MKRYATSRDENEPAIVKALRAAGVIVTRIESTLDPGVPDLLCEVEDAAIAAARKRLEAVLPTLCDLDGAAADDAVMAVDEALEELAKRQRRWVLLEVKNPAVRRRSRGMVRAEDVDAGGYPELAARLGRRLTMNLKYTQADFLAASTAPWAVVETVDEALAACGMMSDEKA